MRISPLFRLLLPTLLIVTATASAQAIHEWRDASGQVHFGDRPPQNVKSKTLQLKTSPAARDMIVTFHDDGFSLSESDRKILRRELHQVLSIYTGPLGLDVRRTVKVSINLFPDKPAFDRWMTQQTHGQSGPYAGVFIPATGQIGIWNRHDHDGIMQTVLHEGSHVILTQISKNAPVWLQEGMAQYVETLKPVDGRLRITPLKPAEKLIRQWVKQGKLITLRDYLSIPDRKWRAMAHDRNAIPYTLAWATTYFLMSSETGRSTLRDLLQGLDKNGTPATLKHLTEIYPGGISQLEYRFFKWAQEEKPPQWY